MKKVIEAAYVRTCQESRAVFVYSRYGQQCGGAEYYWFQFAHIHRQSAWLLQRLFVAKPPNDFPVSRGQRF